MTEDKLTQRLKRQGPTLPAIEVLRTGRDIVVTIDGQSTRLTEPTARRLLAALIDTLG